MEKTIGLQNIGHFEKEDIKIFFQPKYNINSHNIVGAEALARIKVCQNEIIMPINFLPELEKSGSIVDFDLAVFELVCLFLKERITKDAPAVPVSVNISRFDFKCADMPQKFNEIAMKHNIPQSLLHLEITEQEYIENPKVFSEFVRKLKEFGFVTELDDFVTGYGSLNMLIEAPCDIIKLNLNVLKQKDKNQNGKRILNFLVNMASNLNVMVMAECAEIDEDIKLLNSIGCNFAQGFYFKEPVEMAEFDQMLDDSFIEILMETAPVDRYDIQQALQYNELKTLVEYMPGGVFKYRADENGEFVYITDTLFKMTGYSREEFINKYDNKFENFVYFEDRERVLKSIKQQICSGDTDYCEYRYVTKSGEIRWVYDVGHIVTDENGDRWFYVIVVDNTELKKTQEKLKIERETYESILPYTNDFIFEWNIKTGDVVCSETFFKKFGHRMPLNDMLKYNDLSIVHPDDMVKFLEVFELIKHSEKFAACEARIKNNSNKYIWCRLSLTGIKNEQGETIKGIGVLNDINEEKMTLEGVKRKANYDSLTKLQNRMYFEELVTSSLENEKTKSAFIMLDVDNFKEINDNFGHSAGDKILTVIAQRLINSFRSGDYIARIGGDEFAVFLTNIINEEDLFKKLDILINKIREPIELNISSYYPTCSMGACVIEKEDNISFENAYRLADEAMYKAKQNGKNRWSL